MHNREVVLVSGCLLGLLCRYDGKRIDEALNLPDAITIPVCPEQLGGLPTPRKKAEIKCGRVITEDGGDVTEEFERGSTETLKIALATGAKKAYLKAKSPSCGLTRIYSGNFEGKLIEGKGITAELLEQNGVEVIEV